MKPKAPRNEMIFTRVRHEEKELARLAAERKRVTLSELVRAAVLASATNILTAPELKS